MWINQRGTPIKMLLPNSPPKSGRVQMRLYKVAYIVSLTDLESPSVYNRQGSVRWAPPVAGKSRLPLGRPGVLFCPALHLVFSFPLVPNVWKRHPVRTATLHGQCAQVDRPPQETRPGLDTAAQTHL